MKKLFIICLLFISICGFSQTYTIGNVYSTTLTFTSVQVKSLRATPQELIATPGSGKFIMFHSAILKMTYGGTNVFTINAADDLKIVWDVAGAGVAASLTIETTGFIDQAVSMITNAITYVDAVGIASQMENKGLDLFNIGGVEIGGNAGDDNTLTVIVFYSIIDL